MDFRESLTQRLAPLFAELEQAHCNRLAEAAKKNPLANKLTRVFDGRMNYRYYSAPKNGKGQRVLYCWSVGRNVAGFYLGWREVYMKNGTVKRDQWLSRRVKARCKEVAARRAGVALAN
jgi:hypothetical protein